jgi:hypothetical protein
MESPAPAFFVAGRIKPQDGSGRDEKNVSIAHFKSFVNLSLSFPAAKNCYIHAHHEQFI